MDKSAAVGQSKSRGDGAGAQPSGGGKDGSSRKEQEGCVKADGTFSFEYDKVVHSHNYQDIRDIPTGGYAKSHILHKFDPQDTAVNMSKKQLDEKVQQHFKGIYQSRVFDEQLGADPMKLPRLVGGQAVKGQSVDARAPGTTRRVTSQDAKSKLKVMGEHKRTLTLKNRHPLSPQKDDPVMVQYATARKQIRENIAKAQASIAAAHVNSVDRMQNKTLNHVRSRDLDNEQAEYLANNADGPPMINKPSNLTSQQALGMAETTDKIPRGTTFSTLHATIGATHEENATNASTFMGINTLAGAKNTKYRAQFRLHQNSAVNAKTFQRNTDSKDVLDSVSRALNETMDMASKGDLQNLPQGTLSQIHSKSNQISHLTQAYGFNMSKQPTGMHPLQNTGSGPIPFVPRSGLGTPDRFGQTQAFYPKQNPLYDEIAEMNRSVMEPSHIARPHLMRTPQTAINIVATNINSVRDYKFQVFDAHQDKIRRIHQKLMQKKSVSSGGNSSLNSIQRLLSQKLSNTFLTTQGKGMDHEIVLQNSQHNELFKEMNRLNGCFLDVIDNVCGYKVEMGIMLQRLVECYNSIFLQQYEVFYDGRLQKEKELDKEIAKFQGKQKETDDERDLLKQKQELAERAIEVKQKEIERLEEQVAQLEKTVEELRQIIRQDDREAAEEQEKADQKQAELDEKEFMAKDFDRNKRVALKQNPMSAKLLLDPAIVPDYNEVIGIAEGRQEDRNAYVESLYEVIKSMLKNKQKEQKTQTDQACMNNAIMYDYYSYGDSSSEKDETKDKKEEEEAVETQDGKLRRLMEEKGIKIDEEDVDEDDGDAVVEGDSVGKSEAGGLAVEGKNETVNTNKSFDSQRSGKLSTGKRRNSKQSDQGGSPRGSTSPRGTPRSALKKKEQPKSGQNADFNKLELPQTYHAQTLRQMGLRDTNKLMHLHEAFAKMCVKIKKKKQQQGGTEQSDTTKMSFEVYWRIPFKVIAFIANRIQQLEENPQIVENYELMPWHHLKEIIYDIYDHRVKHTPELCGSINTNYCTFNEHLMMYFVDKYRRRQKAEEKVTDLIINLRYYYEHWKRVQLYVSNLGFATRFLPKTSDSPLDLAQADKSRDEALNDYGDPIVQQAPHGYLKDDQVAEHDIYAQEFFLHAYSLLNHDRNNFLESREGKTYVRTKTHDQVSRRIIPLMKGPVGDVQKWSLKMRRLSQKIKNKDGVEQEYLDLDLILYMMVDDFKQQRILFQKEILKQYARSVEANQFGLDLDGFMEMITTSMPPTDETQALEHPLISYPGQISYVRAYIYACTAGSQNDQTFSDDCYIAGASRFGLESPVASVSTRCGFYGNSRDVMQILQDAESSFGKPIRIEAKQFTSFTMGLPEKKNFKKRSMNVSRHRQNEPTSDDDAEMRRKRTLEVHETQQQQLPQKMIPAGLVNMKMEFVENDRNSGRFSPLLGLQKHVKTGNYKFRVQSLKKKALLEDEDGRIELRKSVQESFMHNDPMDQTDQNVPRSRKHELTDVQIGMKKEIIVPSFRTTVDIFAQHFLILRELKHRIELLHQAYYAQMDKKKTWEQVNEIIKVLDTASTYLDFPEQKDASKFMIRSPQEPEKRQFLSEQSPLSPKTMFLSSALGVPKDLGEGTSPLPKTGTHSVALIQEEEEDEEKNEDDEESREKMPA